MTTMSRLEPDNIKDPLVRGQFYAELRTSPERDDWDEWEISEDEAYRPELISYRYYGTQALKRIVAIAAGMDDLRGKLPIGSTVRLPPASWVRQRIRYYAGISDGIR